MAFQLSDKYARLMANQIDMIEIKVSIYYTYMNWLLDSSAWIEDSYHH